MGLSSCSEQGAALCCGEGLLTEVATLVVWAGALGVRVPSSCSAWAQQLWHTAPEDEGLVIVMLGLLAPRA